jgi:serine/threonine protein kinase
VLAGRYVLDEMVAAGGSGLVYRGRDRVLGRVVAVKVARRPAADSDGPEFARHRSEVTTLLRLSHPGVIALLDGALANEQYLVMEYVDGRTLAQLIEAEGRLPAATAVELVAEVADTLAYVHARGVLHRDLKPSNILLDGTGRTRLIDFGIARSHGEAGWTTEPGFIVGTPRYLAPEQARGEALTWAVDVYALGLVLLECLTGRPEYPGPPIESALARLDRPPRVPDAAPPWLARAITAMTASDPGRRPSAAQVSAWLRRRAEEGPAGGRALAGRHVGPPEPTRRSAHRLAVGARDYPRAARGG